MYRTIYTLLKLLYRGKRRRRVLYGYLRLLSVLDSRPVWAIRVEVLRALGAVIGSRVVIKSGVIVDRAERLVIGSDVSINDRCYLSAAGGIRIGSHVSIAHDCSVLTSTHQYAEGGVIREAPLVYGSVTIGDNVWIGAKVTILYNVQIGDDCVIGASAVVNRSLEANGVYVGAPARLIGAVRERSTPRGGV